MERPAASPSTSARAEWRDIVAPYQPPSVRAGSSSPRIPNDYLRRAHDENPYFHLAHRLTLPENVCVFSLKLWDEERGRMVGWREVGERRRKP